MSCITRNSESCFSSNPLLKCKTLSNSLPSMLFSAKIVLGRRYCMELDSALTRKRNKGLFEWSACQNQRMSWGLEEGWDGELIGELL